MPNLLATNLITALLLALSGTLPSGGPALSVDELKCSPRGPSHPGMTEYALVIDDERFDGDIQEHDWDWRAYHKEHPIQSMEIVCWRWLEEHLEVQVARGGTYIVTGERSERLRKGQIAALAAIVAEQDRYRELHGEYAGGVEELADFGGLAEHGLPSYFKLQLKVTQDGWTARVGMVDGRLPRRWETGWGLERSCLAFVGAGIPDRWNAAGSYKQPESPERQPVCPWHRTDTAKGSGGI